MKAYFEVYFECDCEDEEHGVEIDLETGPVDDTLPCGRVLTDDERTKLHWKARELLDNYYEEC